MQSSLAQDFIILGLPRHLFCYSQTHMLMPMPLDEPFCLAFCLPCSLMATLPSWNGHGPSSECKKFSASRAAPCSRPLHWLLLFLTGCRLPTQSTYDMHIMCAHLPCPMLPNPMPCAAQGSGQRGGAARLLCGGPAPRPLQHHERAQPQPPERTAVPGPDLHGENGAPRCVAFSERQN